MVWVNEINLDTGVRLNPATDEMRVVKRRPKNVGIPRWRRRRRRLWSWQPQRPAGVVE